MSLLSLFFVALLAALASAQWSDVFVSYWINATPVRLCAVDQPSICVYVPKPDLGGLDPSNVLLVAVSRSGPALRSDAASELLTEYSMLQAVARNAPVRVVINITRAGLLYTTSSHFRIYSFRTGTWTSSTSYTVCGRTYPFAYWAEAGLYNVTNLTPPLFWLDTRTCTSYRVVATVSGVRNITMPWYSLYIATLLPNVTKIYHHSGLSAWVLNGTRHEYRTHFHHFLLPLGSGSYIAGNTVVPTLVMMNYYRAAHFPRSGPRGYDVLNRIEYELPPYHDIAVLYNIGGAYGDAVFLVRLPRRPNGSSLDVAHVADGTAGFATINMSRYPPSYFMYAAFFTRYTTVEVAVRDRHYTYATRGIACPYLRPLHSAPMYVLNRLNRVSEIEICNNTTNTVVMGLFYAALAQITMYDQYFFVDKIEPGRCARLLWDISLAAKPSLHIFTSESNFCRLNATRRTIEYNVGWRHYYFPNGTLRPVAPLTPDTAYESVWLDVIRTLAQMFNATMNVLQTWLQAQANATQNMQSLVSSLPRFHGTIRMESATSTWLRTTLNELQRWQVAGASGSFSSIALPAVPVAVAPAAAAAVAVAWAASRRDDDVATTAAVAGIALALFGILMTLIYGTGSLALVALGVIVAAAAAAWRRIS